METNKRYVDARELTYTEFPMHWVWNQKDKLWTRRKSGKTIGRIYSAHPFSGKKNYLCMLLNMVKGYTSYEDIRTIEGIVHPIIKSACYALGLPQHDRE